MLYSSVTEIAGPRHTILRIKSLPILTMHSLHAASTLPMTLTPLIYPLYLSTLSTYLPSSLSISSFPLLTRTSTAQHSTA